jgi:hypothetical protein
MKTWDFKNNCIIEREPSFGPTMHGDKEAVFDVNEGRYKKSWPYLKE